METQIDRDALDFFRRLLDSNPSLDGNLEHELTSLAPEVALRVRSMLSALRSKGLDVPSPFTHPPISAPKILGGFELGATLGQGGMGTVFAGE